MRKSILKQILYYIVIDVLLASIFGLFNFFRSDRTLNGFLISSTFAYVILFLFEILILLPRK